MHPSQNGSANEPEPEPEPEPGNQTSEPGEPGDEPNANAGGGGVTEG